MDVVDRPITEAERRQLDGDGFVRIDRFVDPAVGNAMHDRVVELAALHAAGVDVDPCLVLPEEQPDLQASGRADAVLSKIFLLARDPVFLAFLLRPEVGSLVASALDRADVDCFLSQFIFKNPGAWGQPWHRDSYYFPFTPPRPVIGLWLAVTEATLANGCLHVLPGSHTEPVHPHVDDRREGANYGYTEIVDHDMSGSVPVLMDPGDVLLFDSHLMHRSTDNGSGGRRAAMVFHFAAAGTVDRTEELKGYTVNDWIPVWRGGEPVT